MAQERPVKPQYEFYEEVPKKRPQKDPQYNWYYEDGGPVNRASSASLAKRQPRTNSRQRIAAGSTSGDARRKASSSTLKSNPSQGRLARQASTASSVRRGNFSRRGSRSQGSLARGGSSAAGRGRGRAGASRSRGSLVRKGRLKTGDDDYGNVYGADYKKSRSRSTGFNPRDDGNH